MILCRSFILQHKIVWCTLHIRSVSCFHSWFQMCCTAPHFHYIYDFTAQRRRQTTGCEGEIRSTRSSLRQYYGNIVMLRKQDSGQAALCCSRVIASSCFFFSNSSMRENTGLLEFFFVDLLSGDVNIMLTRLFMRQAEEITGEPIYQNKTRTNWGAALLWAWKNSPNPTGFQRVNSSFSRPVSSI